MAEIFPFRAVRYDASRGALESVLTQPYDKITPAMQENYYAASPYNFVSVEKGKSFPGDSPTNNVYTRASRNFEDWLAQGVLAQDGEPSIYAYSQDYAVPGTNRHLERRGFIALGRLTGYEDKIVFRHERTLTAPKADRLELLRHMRAQTGQLFMLYDDPAKHVDKLLERSAQQPATAQLHDEYNVLHRLWAISDAQTIQQIVSAMADQKLIIADGHHRYETALAYRDECRTEAGRIDPDAPFEKAMWTCFNIHQEGLTILPTHRVLRNLANFSMEKFLKAASQYFNWYAYPFASPAERAESHADFRHDLERRGHAGHAIGAYGGGKAFFLLVLRNAAALEQLLPDVSPAQRQLDVVLLHRLLLHKCLGITAEKVASESNITYEREMDAALATVDRGDAQVAFLLNPVRVKQVVEIALGGDVMPQKSTDFCPKLLSGLCVYRM
ncbi:MAG: DUF1015 domain-containing protein [Candidatus Acidiferrales bacterium]